MWVGGDMDLWPLNKHAIDYVCGGFYINPSRPAPLQSEARVRWGELRHCSLRATQALQLTARRDRVASAPSTRDGALPASFPHAAANAPKHPEHAARRLMYRWVASLRKNVLYHPS